MSAKKIDLLHGTLDMSILRLSPWGQSTALLWAVLAVTAAQAPAPAPAAQGTLIHNIHLTGARDIADATAVNRAITVMVRNAASCSPVTTQGAKPCACGFTDDLVAS